MPVAQALVKTDIPHCTHALDNEQVSFTDACFNL